MAEIVATMGGIHDHSISSAPASGLGTKHISPFQHEEDESSLSSSGTEVFDRNLTRTSENTEHWGMDLNGKWQRYGSSESATSTGITSVCSSVAADIESTVHPNRHSPSRKRMLDGTIKQASHALKAHAQIDSQPLPSPSDSTLLESIETIQAAPKRRGRPPKDRSAIASQPSTVKPGVTKKLRRASAISKLQGDIRPRSALPTSLPKDEFAGQCIEAAHTSRLDPYALHPSEHDLLSDQLMNKEVTVYLNIRNAILRLWVQNPLCAVTVEEAAGCAKEGRFYGLAEVAYKWLVRHGYINFGCVEIPRDPLLSTKAMQQVKQRTVVVIGAGVAGLTTARQLEGLFAHASESWTDAGERPPRVIVVEGRKRIGGRVYSKPLRSQVKGSLPDDLRNTAEMGAMIITGFDHGNPLNTIVRGQLGLRYHMLTDELTIYDTDGQPVDEERDIINTELYTDITDRAGEYRAEAQQQPTLKGDEELIDRARDPPADGLEHYQVEPLFPVDNMKHRKPITKRGRRKNAPPGTEKLTGRSRVIEESVATTHSAARAAKTMGWELRDGVARNQSISLHKVAHSSSHPTLGAVMDEAIRQYQTLVDITPHDMRLLNWHHANLEYANAAPVSSLSLSGHDQDTGNEFEGAHSEVVGGYTQVPRGLMNLPTKLDVRFGFKVDSIHYNEDDNPELSTKVVSVDGEVIEADEVVITAPLGVLKRNDIDFDPPLPAWKRGAISRMGFGLLNKLILLYDKPFWDEDRDMFGLLNEAEVRGSLDPGDYAAKRGRFYLIWNCSKISGRPMLVALMAGHSAHEAEHTETSLLLRDINNRLRKTFPRTEIPAPLEVIVTRWKQDEYTRGTYSYVGPDTKPGDYDLMAKPVGNLHFAGEATCGTHPATVHGALLSGLRVAAEVMDNMVGPINLPDPLVLPPPVKTESSVQSTMAQPIPVSQAATVAAAPALLAQASVQAEDGIAIKQEQDILPLYVPPSQPVQAKKLAGPPKQSVCASDDSFWVSAAEFDAADLSYEAAIVGAVLGELGDRPVKPKRPGVNPFLLWTKAKWDECKAHCSTAKSEAGRDNIRQTLGRWWKAASEEVKRPYQEESLKAQADADAAQKEYETASQRWDEEAKRIRAEYAKTHPPPMKIGGSGMGTLGVSKRKTNVSNCVVLDHA
ncbi:SWIRM domain [Teratosphaeria destructans]|uniref:SWIRM domain n=1 Tax=Teratosphaeria destructans TaxID=418781 RepID=A0A9W7SJI1_9PEZI|nr:SWIRM domain [Teratosphaeria destructans]